VLVEGAGGWFTPLSDTLTFADWAQAEQLPVILVVGVKLGCINHAMLTAQAVRQAGCRWRGGSPMTCSRRASATPNIWRR
jgi:dethiobiotin synthetase